MQQLVEFPKFENGDRIIAVKADLLNPNSYGESTHDWTKRDMQRTILNIKVKIRKAMKAEKKVPTVTLLIQRQSSNKVQILPQVQHAESVILPDPPIHIQ
jgi:hypothetical protein